ncbi:MAG: signal peptide peptidase SppA [Nitrospinota bacterium]
MSIKFNSRKRAFLYALLALIVMTTLFYLLLGRDSSTDERSGFLNDRFTNDKVAVIYITDAITSSTAKRVIKELEDWGDDKSVKAIVLRIVTPGGVVAPSQEIYNSVLKIKSEKPIVCSFGSVAASGGYYIALGCDKIIANPGTITGSIGVIMMFNTLYDLTEKIGLQPVVIKSGQFKDTGSPSRPFTEDDKDLLQSIVDDIFNQFLEAVASGREIEIEKARELSAGGRIYTGKQAKEANLVDALGDLATSIEIAGELGGIDGEPKVVTKRKERPSILMLLVGQDINGLIPSSLLLPTGAYFIWEAGI